MSELTQIINKKMTLQELKAECPNLSIQIWGSCKIKYERGDCNVNILDCPKHKITARHTITDKNGKSRGIGKYYCIRQIALKSQFVMQPFADSELYAIRKFYDNF
jgi:hypothetical protein